MKGLSALLVFAILNVLTIASSSARIKRGLYTLAHGYGGLPLSYSVLPYQTSYRSPYLIYQSPYQIMHAASYASPVVHAAPMANYMTMPRYVNVPVARHYDKWSQSHRLPVAKYYTSPTYTSATYASPMYTSSTYTSPTYTSPSYWRIQM